MKGSSRSERENKFPASLVEANLAGKKKTARKRTESNCRSTYGRRKEDANEREVVCAKSRKAFLAGKRSLTCEPKCHENTFLKTSGVAKRKANKILFPIDMMMM